LSIIRSFNNGTGVELEQKAYQESLRRGLKETQEYLDKFGRAGRFLYGLFRLGEKSCKYQGAKRALEELTKSS